MASGAVARLAGQHLVREVIGPAGGDRYPMLDRGRGGGQLVAAEGAIPAVAVGNRADQAAPLRPGRRLAGLSGTDAP